MRVFALETNVEKAARAYLPAGERELFIIRYHPFLFFVRVIRQIFFTFLLTLLALGAEYLQLPLAGVLVALSVVWLAFILPGIVTAYIDWRFDAVVVTNDHVVIIDQTSLFHTEARQMHFENFASVNAVTQFWNLFPFGKLCFDLKEGIGQRLCLRYIPDARNVAVRISECVRAFQRSASGARTGAMAAAALTHSA
jgi:hypothetical protein